MEQKKNVIKSLNLSSLDPSILRSIHLEDPFQHGRHNVTKQWATMDQSSRLKDPQQLITKNSLD